MSSQGNKTRGQDPGEPEQKNLNMFVNMFKEIKADIENMCKNQEISFLIKFIGGDID